MTSLFRVSVVAALGAALVVAPRVAHADRIGPGEEEPTEKPTEPAKPPPDPDADEQERERQRQERLEREGELNLKPTIPRSRMKDIVVEIPGERSSTNITVLVGLSTLTLAAGVVGLKFHLATKKATEAVNADSYTGEVWTPADQTQVDRAERDRRRTIWLYSIGGGLLVATIVAFIATNPESTTTVIHPRAATLTPVEGGAVAGYGWQF